MFSSARRCGSSAALRRWIQPRREIGLASVHASAAANSAAPTPQPNNAAHQHQQTRPAAVQAQQAPRAAQAAQPQRQQAPSPSQQNNARWQQQRQQPQPQRPRGGFNQGAYGSAAPAQRPTSLPDDVDALYHQMQHLGSRWADLHAEAELLEESKKCVLASITLHFMNEGDNKSAGEAKAFAAPEYVEHVRKMVEARRKANQAKVEFEGIKTHMNLTRTYEATRRAEMQML